MFFLTLRYSDSDRKEGNTGVTTEVLLSGDEIYIPSGSLDRAIALVLGVPPMIPYAVHYLAPR